jgi:hypothetical protein
LRRTKACSRCRLLQDKGHDEEIPNPTRRTRRNFSEFPSHGYYESLGSPRLIKGGMKLRTFSLDSFSTIAPSAIAGILIVCRIVDLSALSSRLKMQIKKLSLDSFFCYCSACNWNACIACMSLDLAMLDFYARYYHCNPKGKLEEWLVVVPVRTQMIDHHKSMLKESRSRCELKCKQKGNWPETSKLNT